MFASNNSSLCRPMYGGQEVQNKSQFWKQNKLQRHMQIKKKKIAIQKTQRQIWKHYNMSENTTTNQTNRKR